MMKFEKLSDEERRTFQELALCRYLDGECYAFAAAMNAGLDWEIWGLMTGTPGTMIARHAVAKDPEEKMWDVRGQITGSDLTNKFNFGDIVALERITLADLRKIRPVHDTQIEQASMVAQTLWPDLPWKESTFQGRTKAFLADLENLCRKHHVWLRGSFDTAPIVLDQSCGDEKGFIVSQTLTGQYFVNRLL